MRPRLLLAALSWLALPLAVEAAAPATPASSAQPALVLANATPAGVRARLGEPAVASEEGRGALWTYRREDCALMVFFKDEGQGLRVSGVTASARRRGEPPPTVESCLGGAGS